MTEKGISCKRVLFTVSLVQYALELSSDPNRLYKQICNVAFFYNNFHQLLTIEMTFTARCSLVATSFEREDVRICSFANLTCDY